MRLQPAKLVLDQAMTMRLECTLLQLLWCGLVFFTSSQAILHNHDETVMNIGENVPNTASSKFLRFTT
jgi:hypothetical protein